MELAKIKVNDDIGNIKVEQENGYVVITCEPNNNRIKTWNDLIGTETPNGSVILSMSGWEITRPCIKTIDGRDKDIFINEKNAKSALAMAQISQLKRFYGGEITNEEWDSSIIPKYIIFKTKNKISATMISDVYYFLAFHTEKQRDYFLENNEQLVKDYLMID